MLKTSELAKQLKPYIIKWINDASGGGGSTAGAAGGSYAPTPHALGSYHHNGQLPHNSTWMSNLNGDTHTIYASADGSGTRSAYIAERLNKSIFAGSGITGGGALTANQTLTLKTPTVNLAASATNVVNTVGHTHAIDAKSDVSATNTADLLKSTASGGLTLKTLDVMGAVDILGGDLTVGSAMTLFVSESGNNVGVAGAPDPQFALDVNGPFHADAIYGPLGRLLKDCIFLAHFDGPHDLDDYSGTPQTVQGLLPVTSSALTYRLAKYGKGLVNSRAASNLFYNPVFDNSGTWNIQWNVGADLTVTKNTDKNFVYSGSNSSKVIRSGSGSNRIYYDSITIVQTGSYMLSAYVKRGDSGSIGANDMTLYYGAIISPSYIALDDGWYLMCASVSGSVAAVATGVAFVAQNVDYYVGGAQLEWHPTKAYLTPLAHGDMVVGHDWDGSLQNSQTTRIATRLIYNISMPDVWSIGTWFQPWVGTSEYTTSDWLWTWADDANNSTAIYFSSTGVLTGRWADNGTATTETITIALNRAQKYHIAATYDGSSMRFYLDGTYTGSLSASRHATSPSTLGIGSYYNGANPVTGLIDDFYILKRVQSEDDIGAIVDSEVPVAAEVGATSWYSGGVAPIWVDRDGLWMRDHTGLEVFGWSAVDNKSWGGVTLDMGDNLIGRYGSGSGGWMRWDRSAGQLKLGYSNACSMAFDGSGACIVGKLQMPGASGAISIGTTPPTASNLGTGIWLDRNGLVTLSSNASQIRIVAATGALFGGGGDVRINASGLYIGSGSSSVYESKRALNFYSNITGGSPIVAKMWSYYSAPNGYFNIQTEEHDISRISIIAYGASDVASTKEVVLETRTGTGTLNSSLRLESTSASLFGDFIYSGTLTSEKSGDYYDVYAFYPLATPLTSTSWDGDARSSSPKTLIDLSAVFGAPPGIKAALFSVQARDSNSAATAPFVILSPNSTNDDGLVVGIAGLANDTWGYGSAVVPCNSNGDVYYQLSAGGALTLDVVLKIWGYWI